MTWKEEFVEGCNYMNVSDPPSDHKWILSFIESKLKELADEIEKVIPQNKDEAVNFETDDLRKELSDIRKKWGI